LDCFLKQQYKPRNEDASKKG